MVRDLFYNQYDKILTLAFFLLIGYRTQATYLFICHSQVQLKKHIEAIYSYVLLILFLSLLNVLMCNFV